jgi:hypothetical protein
MKPISSVVSVVLLFATASSMAYAQGAPKVACVGQQPTTSAVNAPQKAGEGENQYGRQNAGEGENQYGRQQAAAGGSNAQPQKAGEGENQYARQNAGEGENQYASQKAGEGESQYSRQNAAATAPCKG